MKTAGKRVWFRRMEKLNVILSIITAIIEIGIFLSYIKNAISIEIATLSGLAVTVVFFGQDSWRNRKSLKDERLQERLYKDFPAVVAFLKAWQSLPTEFKVDTQTLYDEIIVTCDVDGSDATYTKQAKGRNVSNIDLTKMFFVVCGETSVENERLKPKVFRNLEGKEKEDLAPSVPWSTSTVKVIGVEFNPPIVPRIGEVDVTFSAKWLGAFVSKYGYVFVNLSHCVRGIKKLTINVRFKEKVKRCSVWTWDLKKHELNELEKLKKPKPHNNTYTIKWQRAKPETNKIYILRYYRPSV